MEIELMGWIGEDMSDEEVIAYIDEIEAEEEKRRDDASRKLAEENARRQIAEPPTSKGGRTPPSSSDSDSETFNRRRKVTDEMAPRRTPAIRRNGTGRRQSGKMTITQALSGDDRRQRSLAPHVETPPTPSGTNIAQVVGRRSGSNSAVTRSAGPSNHRCYLLA